MSVANVPFLRLFQGCCISRPPRDSEGSPYSPGAAGNHHGDSSSRAINSAPVLPSISEPPALQASHSQSHSTISSSRVSHSASRRRFSPNLPLSEHYNQPLRPHIWHSKRRVWSRNQLVRERNEFFDTRVTGRPEVWAALSAATSLMRDGDIATAQGIIDAAGVTVPTGDLCDGCYDENGALYRLPEIVVMDPVNVVDSPGSEDHPSCGETGDLGYEVSNTKLGVDVDTEDEYDEELERRREEKGKGNERDFIKVTTRLSDRGGPDITIGIGKEQNVGVLARKVQTDARVGAPFPGCLRRRQCVYFSVFPDLAG